MPQCIKKARSFAAAPTKFLNQDRHLNFLVLPGFTQLFAGAAVTAVLYGIGTKESFKGFNIVMGVTAMIGLIILDKIFTKITDVEFGKTRNNNKKIVEEGEAYYRRKENKDYSSSDDEKEWYRDSYSSAHGFANITLPVTATLALVGFFVGLVSDVTSKCCGGRGYEEYKVEQQLSPPTSGSVYLERDELERDELEGGGRSSYRGGGGYL